MSVPKDPDTWAEASWSGTVVSLEQLQTTGEARVGLRIGMVDVVHLTLPKDHPAPGLNEKLTVTLHRGAQT